MYHVQCIPYNFQTISVISILENTVQNSRQREAILDEALASTDISLARSHLKNSLDENPALNDKSYLNESSKKEVAFESGGREEEHNESD